MLSVVVPCYNEEKNIEKLVSRFQNIYESLCVNGFELILVDNGSKDNTSYEIDKCCEKHNYVKKVVVEKNVGYGYGILQGLYHAKGEWIGWIHADLQLPPEAFAVMMQRIENEHLDEDYYFKGLRKNRPIVDKLFTVGMSCFESFYLKKKLWDINAQPTLISRKLLDSFDNPPNDFSLDLYGYYLARLNQYKIIRIPVIQQERTEGESSWNNGMSARFKLIKRTLAYSKQMKKNMK